jgi:hypothetical protein
MKKKLKNQLTSHLDVIIWMFAQKNYIFEIFPYDQAIEEWKVAHT